MTTPPSTGDNARIRARREGFPHAAIETSAEFPLTIGKMASLNCVSEKTLYLYQEKGLLEPSHVDPQTGYRYYSLEQCSTLDAITGLKAIGFSLDDIKGLLDDANPARLGRELEGKLDELHHRQRELKLAEAHVQALLDACRTCEDPPLCNQIMLESLPSRHALVFDVPPVSPDDVDNMQWEMAVRTVKTELRDKGHSFAVFQEVSGMVTRENLLNGSLVTHQAIIFLDDTQAEILGDAVSTVPGGQYLTMYFNGTLLPDGSSPEYPAIRRMLEYAERKGFEIAGNYIGETIASTPVFAYQGRDTFLKCELPVRRKPLP